MNLKLKINVLDWLLNYISSTGKPTQTSAYYTGNRGKGIAEYVQQFNSGAIGA